jgi:hypothetical protein
MLKALYAISGIVLFDGKPLVRGLKPFYLASGLLIRGV